MKTLVPIKKMETISITQGFKLTPEQFDQLAQVDQMVGMELTKDGELIIMSPTGSTAGGKNFNLYLDLGIWNCQTKLGQGFDSSTVFVLPNGARINIDTKNP